MKVKQAVRYVISVLIADRVGILRDISTAVTELGGNIDGISQTVVAGYFTVILTATFGSRRRADEITAAVREKFAPGEADVVARPYKAGAAGPTVKGQRFVVTLTGKDRPGILKTVMTFMAAKGINIEDWYVLFSGAHVTHMGEVTIPGALDIKQVQDEFQQCMASLRLKTGIQHENIFRATHEVGAIERLIDGV